MATPIPNTNATPLPGVNETPKPNTTAAPTATAKPTVTENPNTTAKPTATAKPSGTSVPTATSKPNATATPTGTQKPTAAPPIIPTTAPTATPNIGDGIAVENKEYKYRVYVWYNDGAITDFDLVKLQDNGTFKPDNNITRAEVVIIVNRVTDREADTEYVNKNMSTVNRFTDLKDKSYWAFYEIIEAANTHTAIETSDGEAWVK